MSARGWATGAVVSNYVLRRGVGLARGFQRYDDQMLEREVARGAPERTGQETTRAALRLLDQLGRSARPILLWVHYQDPHGPYTPPARARALTRAREERAADGGRVLPLSRNDRGHGALPRYQLVESRRDVAFYRAGYNGEVAQVDGAVGELLQGVRRHGLWDRSILVFAADHGESLGEDDYWFAHGDLLSDALVRVPLLVRVPGRAPAVRHDAVSLIDVFPTVAALAGVPTPARARGRDLFAPDLRSAPVYLSTLEASAAPCRGVVAEGFRYATCPDRGRAHEELSALPWNVRTPRLARTEALRRLRRHLAAATLLPAPASRQQHLTGADRAALQTLGYVSGR
jgi:hypothetical protein